MDRRTWGKQIGALAGVAATCAWRWPAVATAAEGNNDRPRYIFINETADHRHDLAFKMSLKLAEKRSGVENALVLLPRLPAATTLEHLAVDLFERWKIGQARGGKGLLYVYAQEENRFRIEVSYALEGTLPDSYCRRLEEAARTYMLSEIPQDFISELLITMNLRAAGERDGPDDVAARPEWMTTRFLSGGGGVSAKGYALTLKDYEDAVQTLPPAAFKDFQPAASAEQTVRRYLASLGLGLGDPRLPLLTSGSRIFRAVVPRNAAQQRRILSYFEKAMPYQLVKGDELAYAVFRPGVPNLPIVLRKGRDALWYVDEPKSWTFFHRFEDGTDFYPKFDDLPLLGALQGLRLPHAHEPIYRQRTVTPPVLSYPVDLDGIVADIQAQIDETPGDARLHAALADVYFFEMNWLTRALASYERAARLAPDRLEYRWRLLDLYLNSSEIEPFLAELGALAHQMPRDATAQQWHRFYRDAYTFKPGEFFATRDG
ncbi:MAG TPA: TPM domain-containing protein [Burkholderiales bacterium]|nr:TPM domain-containing protein [Burkholderiales bacterium]